MTKRNRAYVGISDAQANAEALHRRTYTYAPENAESLRVAWDFHRREPKDLREAVHYVRKAYADEVPDKLHEGYDSIGEGGTPKMTARAEGYIFGRPDADDAKRGKCICMDLVKKGRMVEHQGEGSASAGHFDDCPANPQNQAMLGYYHTPFRAALANLEHGAEAERKRAAIVAHVTIGSQGPVEAALAEGVPAWCAQLVAEDALRSFLRSLSDIKVHIRRQMDYVEEGTAA